MEVEINKLREELCDAKQKELAQGIQGRQERVRLFRGRPRREQLGILSESEARLKGQRLQVERELQRIEGGAPASDEQASATNIEQKARPATERPGNLQREAADACQSQIVLLDERLEWLNRLRRVWRQRYDVAAEKQTPAHLQQWLEDASEFHNDLSDAIRSLENRRDSARTERGSTNLAVERRKNAVPATTRCKGSGRA